MFCASRRGRVCQDAPIRIRKKYVTVFMKTGTKILIQKSLMDSPFLPSAGHLGVSRAPFRARAPHVVRLGPIVVRRDQRPISIHHGHTGLRSRGSQNEYHTRTMLTHGASPNRADQWVRNGNSQWKTSIAIPSLVSIPVIRIATTVISADNSDLAIFRNWTFIIRSIRNMAAIFGPSRPCDANLCNRCDAKGIGILDGMSVTVIGAA